MERTLGGCCLRLTTYHVCSSNDPSSSPSTQKGTIHLCIRGRKHDIVDAAGRISPNLLTSHFTKMLITMRPADDEDFNEADTGAAFKPVRDSFGRINTPS
ncbi:hypothetical protein HZ326_16341 [Fusarium oxysporum f. sp. albedinis]|nr:hypothetical protein HZ326_16341 [Fusarium oxysporum f. sp. albedinis]